MRKSITSINRVTAAVLAVIWLALAIAGLAAVRQTGNLALAVAVAFALLYAVLWTRVALLARLLTWTEVLTPWRAR